MSIFKIFKKKERIFNVKIIATGFMSNRYTFFEFTGPIKPWQLKHNGAAGYVWHRIVPLEKRFGLNPDKFIFLEREINK